MCVHILSWVQFVSISAYRSICMVTKQKLICHRQQFSVLEKGRYLLFFWERFGFFLFWIEYGNGTFVVVVVCFVSTVLVVIDQTSIGQQGFLQHILWLCLSTPHIQNVCWGTVTTCMPGTIPQMLKIYCFLPECHMNQDPNKWKTRIQRQEEH